MRYLPILFALLIAAPAWAQSQWPASKVVYSDADTVEGERDVHRDYAHASLPTCDADAQGTTAYINDGLTAGQCSTDGGSAWVLCSCSDDQAWVALGGTHPIQAGDFAAGAIFDVDVNASAAIIGSKVKAASITDRGTVRYGTTGEVQGLELSNVVLSPVTFGNFDFTGEVTGEPDSMAVEAEHSGTQHSDFLPLAGGTLTGPFSTSVGVQTFAEGDTTPDVSGGNSFRTYPGVPVTITRFDAGGGSHLPGHLFLVRSGFDVTYDCTSQGLICGTRDFITYTNDITEWRLDATGYARLVGFVDGIMGPKTPVLSGINFAEIDGSAELPELGSGFGTLWVESGENPNRLYYRGEDDSEHRIAYYDFWRECQRSITTEEVGDILMCGKANGTITITGLNCVALGDVVPDSQTIEIVECTIDGAACAGSDITITATALETNYSAEIGPSPDYTIDPGDWWGLQFLSIGSGTEFQADFLHCQVSFVEN
jgi:hypothetical protein